MNPTINKQLAAIAVALAAVFAFVPRSTAAAAPVSMPPRSGLQMHWFHSHASVRSLESRESRFGSKAVIGLESMRDLASLKATYRFESVRAVPALHAAEVTLDDTQLHELLASAPSDPRLRYVSPPGPLRHVLNLPSDPLLQSVDPKTSLPYEWQFASAHLEHALDLTPGDARIQVGVIDTGVEAVPDLKGKIDGLYDVDSFGVVRPSPSPTGNDDYGHGTAVASLIAAASGDDFGMAGFGGAAHVVGVHAGARGSFTDSDVAFGLAKLDELGVRIVNLSLGSSFPSSPILVDAIHKAAADGMLIVAAAGNEGGNVGWPAADLQPADGDRSYGLAVGATNQDGSLASFSNSGTHLSLVAPGNFAGDCSGVLVALPHTNMLSDGCYPQWAGPGGAKYGYIAGTSFSSPEVAGVAALVWAARPELKNYQVADIIKQSAARPTGAGWNPTKGCGQLDAGAAVELALSRSAFQWITSEPGFADPCSVDGNDPAGWPGEENQTITFGTLADRTTADPDFHVHATASSGLPVEYEATESCKVHGNVVHLTGSGLCAITAVQPGNSAFNPAFPVTQVFAITDAVVPTAMPAFGKAGAVVKLRYRIRGNSTVKTTIVVRRNGAAVARLSRTGDVESGHVYGAAWRSPAASKARFSFCVTVRDRQPTRSYTSCAPIRLERAVSRR
ncbi:MAG: S8 family peptidase [Gaiellaceae bacterium]